MSSQVTLLQQMQEMQRVASQPPSIEPNEASGVSFSDAMRDVVGRVNEQQNIASRLMTAVDAGQRRSGIVQRVEEQVRQNGVLPSAPISTFSSTVRRFTRLNCWKM